MCPGRTWRRPLELLAWKDEMLLAEDLTLPSNAILHCCLAFLASPVLRHHWAILRALAWHVDQSAVEIAGNPWLGLARS